MQEELLVRRQVGASNTASQRMQRLQEVHTIAPSGQQDEGAR